MPPASNRRTRRCAIYTRKSSEEGLEQDFNSLDAQREACEAYIQSQAREGWQLVRTRYDDGGYSGGTLERPAVEQLLADIASGKIDTVVVYKVDRLTRSLGDFAKIVEVFDAREVSFVSVTQQFNTTSSMGRLTLNMLLSFAQFEREVTGERIRDKIAASKRKGLWMGGYAPLGYAPDGRTLVIVPSEAETVRTIFRFYLELGTVEQVKKEADRRGLITKLRSATRGRMRGGRPFSRGHLYHILGNALYAGQIAHKGQRYEGQHPAIVDSDTWDAVQKQLAQQGPARVARRRSSGSPLQGKLFDEDGIGMTPTHTVKSGRRYRYYVSRNPSAPGQEQEGCDSRRRLRLPAREIERTVERAVGDLLAVPSELVRLARESQLDVSRVPELLRRLETWSGSALDVVRRVNFGADAMEIEIDLSRFINGDVVIRRRVPTQVRTRGGECRLVLPGEGNRSGGERIDPALVQTVIRGRRWFDQLASGKAGSMVEIAAAEGVSDRYVGRLVPLAFLAPDIVASILSGNQPVELTTEALTKRVDLPFDWAAQRQLLGFA